MYNEITKKRGKGQGLIKGSLIISVGAFTAKLIGALYRVPLMSLIGADGIGVYQMVYPLYCLLLTASATGIPSGLSRLFSSHVGSSGERQKDAALIGGSLLLFGAIGAAGSFIMAVFSGAAANLQGRSDIASCYLYLAPSVFLVSLIACFRGYFQGKRNMYPTAVSEVAEQVAKVTLGLLFAVVALRSGKSKLQAVNYILLAVTLSEAFALAVLIFTYSFKRVSAECAFSPLYKQYYGYNLKKVLAATLPVTASVALFPLSQFIDSAIIARNLSTYTDNAFALYGLFAGGALIVLNLPVTVCYGLSVALVPTLAKREGKQSDKQNATIELAVKCTTLIALPCCVFVFFYAEKIALFLYPSLSEAQIATLVGLLKCGCLLPLFSSLSQTLAGGLIGVNKAKRAMLSTAIACTVKTALTYFLTLNVSFSVYGCAVAVTACYFVAFLLNLMYSIGVKNLTFLLSASAKCLFCSIIALTVVLTVNANIIIVGAIYLAVYLLAAFFVRVFDLNELKDLSRKRARTLTFKARGRNASGAGENTDG